MRNSNGGALIEIPIEELFEELSKDESIKGGSGDNLLSDDELLAIINGEKK